MYFNSNKRKLIRLTSYFKHTFKTRRKTFKSHNWFQGKNYLLTSLSFVITLFITVIIFVLISLLMYK